MAARNSKPTRSHCGFGAFSSGQRNVDQTTVLWAKTASNGVLVVLCDRYNSRVINLSFVTQDTEISTGLQVSIDRHGFDNICPTVNPNGHSTSRTMVAHPGMMLFRSTLCHLIRWSYRPPQGRKTR